MLLLSLIFLAAYSSQLGKISAQQYLEVVAGTGSNGHRGDGGDAKDADLKTPSNVWLSYNRLKLYITDYNDHVVRVVDKTTNIITTFAGDRKNKYDGDGSKASLASIKFPFASADDTNGNVYITESGSNRIRKVNTNNIITTIAGSGNNRAGSPIQALQANLDEPTGLFLDTSGRLFFCDSKRAVVRRMNLNTNILTIIAGSVDSSGYSGDGGRATNAQLDYPGALWTNTIGEVFILDRNNHVIRRISPSGIITKFAGQSGRNNDGYSGDGGLAINAQISEENWGIMGDASGNVYFSDTSNNRIRKIDKSGIISTAVGTGQDSDKGSGTPGETDVTEPGGIFLTVGGDMYIAEPKRNRVLLTSIAPIKPPTSAPIRAPTAKPTSAPISAPTAKPTSAPISAPTAKPTSPPINAPTAKPTSAPISAPTAKPTLVPISAPSAVPSSSPIAIPTTAPSSPPVSFPTAGPTLSPTETCLTYPPTNIYCVAGSGRKGQMNSAACESKLNTPYAVLKSTCSGDIYVVENQNHRVRAVNHLTGNLEDFAGTGEEGYGGDGGNPKNAKFQHPRAIVEDTACNLYIADSCNGRIRKVGASGDVISTFAGGGDFCLSQAIEATNAVLHQPIGLFVDDQYLYFAESLSHVVRSVRLSTGIMQVVAGQLNDAGSVNNVAATAGKLNFPYGVYVDSTGVMYISDRDNFVVRKVGKDGVISTYAGVMGSSGFSGDSALATSAALSERVRSIWGDTAGGLFIADANNHRIRRVGCDNIIDTVVGTGLFNFNGNGLNGVDTNIVLPTGLFVSNTSEVYFTEAKTHRVRAGLFVTAA